jgi:hypothetical protein
MSLRVRRRRAPWGTVRRRAFRLEVEGLEGRQMLTAFIVNSPGNLGEAMPGSGNALATVNPNTITLASAIEAADDLNQGPTTPVTINFSGPMTISLSGEVNLLIYAPVDIDTQGQTVVIDGKKTSTRTGSPWSSRTTVTIPSRGSRS